MVHVYPEHLGITRCGYHCFQNKIETIKVSAQKKSVGGLNARFAGLKNRLPAPVLSSFISSVISTSFPWSNSLIYPVSYTHLRAHETRHDLVCRLLLEKK